MICPIETDEVAVYLAEREVSLSDTQVDNLILSIWILLEKMILPRFIRDEDTELFVGAFYLQLEYELSEEYKTAGYRSFRIGNFSCRADSSSKKTYP
ncbi:hypothetical protein AGMMS49975_02790 [Clostridia bacterium]|nr:hypothetical protein AGMMS49975_02790 [Clostridia bacterium]